MCTLDGIIDTVYAVHPLMPLIDLLKSHGKLVTVGVPLKPVELLLPSLVLGKNANVYNIDGIMVYLSLKVTVNLVDFN